MENKIQYGCLPAKYDARDYKLCASNVAVEYPREFILDNLPRIKNQKAVQSCCAHATSSILEYYAHNQYYLSTNFIYGIQKKLCNQKQMGMYLVDALKISQKCGDMTEIDCMGNDEVPSCWRLAENAYLDDYKVASARRFRINSYYLCQTNNDIKYALMNYGPVLGAIYWRENYLIDDDSVIYFNRNSNGGGHAVMIVGWDSRGWIIQNSWGEEFGKNGRFILPYDYGFVEARAVIDEYNDEELNGEILIKPVNNPLFNICYKLVNVVVNIFKKTQC